ncbi:hypothetical protein QTN25_002826 [Entamoeba marina]
MSIFPSVSQHINDRFVFFDTDEENYILLKYKLPESIEGNDVLLAYDTKDFNRYSTHSTLATISNNTRTLLLSSLEELIRFNKDIDKYLAPTHYIGNFFMYIHFITFHSLNDSHFLLFTEIYNKLNKSNNITICVECRVNSLEELIGIRNKLRNNQSRNYLSKKLSPLIVLIYKRNNSWCVVPDTGDITFCVNPNKNFETMCLNNKYCHQNPIHIPIDINKDGNINFSNFKLPHELVSKDVHMNSKKLYLSSSIRSAHLHKSTNITSQDNEQFLNFIDYAKHITKFNGIIRLTHVQLKTRNATSLIFVKKQLNSSKHIPQNRTIRVKLVDEKRYKKKYEKSGDHFTRYQYTTHTSPPTPWNIMNFFRTFCVSALITFIYIFFPSQPLIFWIISFFLLKKAYKTPIQKSTSINSKINSTFIKIWS